MIAQALEPLEHAATWFNRRGAGVNFSTDKVCPLGVEYRRGLVCMVHTVGVRKRHTTFGVFFSGWNLTSKCSIAGYTVVLN